MSERTNHERDRDAAVPESASARADRRKETLQNVGRQPAAAGPSGDAALPLDKVDDASDDSFPASDAPAWTGTRAGSPRTDP